MKFARNVSLLVMIASFSAICFSQDLKPDPTFNPVLGDFDIISDALLIEDGKLMVAGGFCFGSGGSACTPRVRRLNADGSIDPTFNATVGKFPGLTSYFYTINRLPDGKFFLSGRMSVGGVSTNYVRLNSDGSVDSTLALGVVGFSYNPSFRPQPDGKYVGCGEKTINGQLHDVAYRINADGTPDPTFRVTFTDGFCREMEVLPDGKILIGVGTDSGQTEVKQLARLNADGSKDNTFDPDIQVSSYGYRLSGFATLPNGKVMMSYESSGSPGPTLRRLSSTGATEATYPNCAGNIFVPLSNGDMLTNGCKRWANTNHRVGLSRMSPNGSLDPTMDDPGGYTGIRDIGNGTFYGFGGGTIVRLIPNTDPPKAKFDFDGDGKSDLVVYRPSDQTWYLKRSSDGFAYAHFGLADDLLAAGHYDNDGRTDIGIFRNGTLHSSSPAFGHRQIFIGQAGDKPMLGNVHDFGGNLGDFVVRGLRSGSVQWFYRDGNTASNPVGTSLAITLPGELSTDKPVVGDFNGDSRDDIGYFRDGLWYTSDFVSYQAPQTLQWGIAGDIPVPGDYDGDRQDDYAIFRPSNGQWWINRSSLGMIALTFGQNGDIPVPADYDGDGKMDVAIYRNGQWWQFRMGTGTVFVDNWGIAGDKPVQAQHQ